MKNLSLLSKLSLIVLLTIIFSSCATQKEKQARITLVDSLIKNNSFKFVAQQANPLRAGLVSQRLLQLDGSYYLKVNKDTVSCYLPYFGVAQQAPYASNDNGIQFVTSNFDYLKKKINNGFEITIAPKKTEKANKLFLSISETGSATLYVNSNSRDAISFSGNIEKP